MHAACLIHACYMSWNVYHMFAKNRIKILAGINALSRWHAGRGRLQQCHSGKCVPCTAAAAGVLNVQDACMYIVLYIVGSSAK